jgi:serine protease AprX
MVLKKVKAYHLHETEVDIVNQMINTKKITNEKKAGSFVIGDMEENDIPDLQKQGLIVQVLEDEPIVNTPGTEAKMFASMIKNRSSLRDITNVDDRSVIDLNSISIDDTEPQVYLLKIDGPLLEEYRKILENNNVILLEYIPTNNYTTKLTKDQFGILKNLDFVKSISLYSPEDSGPVTSPRAILLPSAEPVPSEQEGKMKTYDIRLHTNDQEDLKKVQDWLVQNNVNIAGSSGRKIRISLLSDSDLPWKIRELPQVALIEEYIPPVLHNDIARVLFGIDNASGNNPSTNIELKGEDQIVGVADTGLDDTHSDFQGRIVEVVPLGRPNNSTDTHGHGTHVSGSILGDGTASNGKYAGVAPKSKLFFQSIMDDQGRLGGLPVDLNDLFKQAYEKGARIHNNSWGAFSKGFYRMNSMEVDEFVQNHRDMLIVISAGNEGVASNRLNSKKGYVDWFSLDSPATAKNALTVGASRSSRTEGGWSHYTYKEVWPADYPDPPIGDEKISGNPECMAAFSGRGPCRDLRVKPDLIGPGTDILSTKSSHAPLENFAGSPPNKPQYGYMSGTSMSSPLVAGCAAIVREYYTKKRSHNPSAALLKATLINGTRWLKGDDSIADIELLPNYHQGFGSVYLPYTIPNNMFPNMRLEFVDTWTTDNLKFNETGDIIRYQFSITQSDWLRVCLVWTDPPGNAIQNNLSLVLDKEGDITKKWISNESWPHNLKDLDSHNNVQVIRLEDVKPGRYNIHIIASNLLKQRQDFALVIYGNLTSDQPQIYKNGGIVQIL